MASDPPFDCCRLIMLSDGTSDLLLSDVDGAPIPEPYDHATMQAALIRISETVDGYLRRMESDDA